MSLDPRTPVLVGAGVAHQHVDDPDAALEAIELMAQRVRARRAAVAARGAQSILVPRGTWRYRDPGRLLATRFGADARTVIGEFGILQQTLVTRACTAIARGELDVALVVGGEAKYRDLRAQIAGTRASETEQLDATPDDVLVPAAEIIPPIEIAAGLTIPAAQYAIIETALRAARGQTVATPRASWPSCGPGSARSPRPTPTRGAGTRSRPSSCRRRRAKNPMYAAPYTRWHCSQWNVDQASAFVVCSAEAAERSGVAREQLGVPARGGRVERDGAAVATRRAAPRPPR